MCRPVGKLNHSHQFILKLRNSTRLGVARVATFEESIPRFLDSLFLLVFKLSPSLQESISNTQEKNTAKSVAESFFEKVMTSNATPLYKELIQDDLFSYVPEDINDLYLGALAKILKRILLYFQENHEDSFPSMIQNVLDESPSLDAAYIQDQFRTLFKLDEDDLLSGLSGCAHSRLE